MTTEQKNLISLIVLEKATKQDFHAVATTFKKIREFFEKDNTLKILASFEIYIHFQDSLFHLDKVSDEDSPYIYSVYKAETKNYHLRHNGNTI